MAFQKEFWIVATQAFITSLSDLRSAVIVKQTLSCSKERTKQVLKVGPTTPYLFLVSAFIALYQFQRPAVVSSKNQHLP